MNQQLSQPDWSQYRPFSNSPALWKWCRSRVWRPEFLKTKKQAGMQPEGKSTRLLYLRDFLQPRHIDYSRMICKAHSHIGWVSIISILWWILMPQPHTQGSNPGL